MSRQFAFLEPEWPGVFEAAGKAETAVHADPRTACFYARRALELAVMWAYKHDPALKLPYQDNLSALIHDPTFKQAAGEAASTRASSNATSRSFLQTTLWARLRNFPASAPASKIPIISSPPRAENSSSPCLSPPPPNTCPIFST